MDTQKDIDDSKDFLSVRGGDVFSRLAGYGWDQPVSEFQRSVDGVSEPATSLFRDGHWHSAIRTFQFQADGNQQYNVWIYTGDRNFARNHLEIRVEGVNDPQVVHTAANQFATVSFTGARDTDDDGYVRVTFTNLGGDPYWVVNGIDVAKLDAWLPPDWPAPPPLMEPDELRFDFGTSSSPLENGFTPVDASNVYDPNLGYGWITNASTFNRSIDNALLRDGHWGSSNTFLVNVDEGEYIVNVTLGDASFARNNIEVAVNGAVELSGLATPAGQFLTAATDVVSPVDGQLAIRVRSTGGDPYFTINALEIWPVAYTGTHELELNGNTVSGSGATANALITVSASQGSVSSVDEGVLPITQLYAGVQVQADENGEFSFTFDPPGGGGTVMLTTLQIDGRGQGTAEVSVAAPDARRFDFNGSGNITLSGFIPVRGNNLYNANNGYGWTQSVPEFQRGDTGYNLGDQDNVPLYRDGHWGSAARTFQVAVDPGASYDVRVYVGDRSFARNNIQVSVEDADPVVIPPTTANQFRTAVISGSDADNNGILTVTIANLGGDPYWVINGVDVWQSGTPDPAAAPLLAATWGTEMVGGWLTEAAVDAVLPVAREYWVSTGLTDWQVDHLHRTPVAIGDLSYRGALGVARPEGIWLDASGAELGWHTSVLTPNSQLLTSSYDLLTVVTHELGHVIGYNDLNPHLHPDHIMAGVLQPGVSRMGLLTDGSSWSPAVGEADSLLSLERGLELSVVDRALHDLLADAPRAVGDVWGDRDDDFERLLGVPAEEQYEELDAFFARL